MANPSSAKPLIKAVVPKLHELVENVVFGDIWNRPELSKRDRSMLTVATLIATGRLDPLRSHMEQALDHGVTPQELTELITHVAIYAGFPASVSAALVARPLFEDLGLIPKINPASSD
jgi:4-carboxymuconolactone decarboxylase